MKSADHNYLESAIQYDNMVIQSLPIGRGWRSARSLRIEPDLLLA